MTYHDKPTVRPSDPSCLYHEGELLWRGRDNFWIYLNPQQARNLQNAFAEDGNFPTYVSEIGEALAEYALAQAEMEQYG
jgi:hypothetical protein